MTTPVTSQEPSLRPYRPGFIFSFFNAMGWTIALGSPLVLLAESLGATAAQVGLLSSFVFLLLPIQVLATVGLPRLGYKRQVLAAWSLRTVFLLIPLGIALMEPEGEQPHLVNLLLFSVFMFCFFRSLGTCAVQPWLFDLLPENLQSRYFGTDVMVVGCSGIMTLVFSGLTFSYFTGYLPFSIQYGFALIGSIIALVALSRLPSVPPPEPFDAIRVFTEGPRILREPGSFRKYLLITIIWITSGSAVGPFGVYYLRVELDLARDVILLFIALLSAGAIAGAWVFRTRLDRIGVRNAFALVVGLHLMVFSIWISFIGGRHWFDVEFGIWTLVIAYFFLGVAGSCFQITHLRYLSFLASGRDRALRVSLQTATLGFLAGLASIGWGFLFREPSGEPGMNVNAFLLYFVGIFIIQFVLLPLIRSLKEPSGDYKPLINSRGFLRTFRFLATIPVLRNKK